MLRVSPQGRPGSRVAALLAAAVLIAAPASHAAPKKRRAQPDDKPTAASAAPENRPGPTAEVATAAPVGEPIDLAGVLAVAIRQSPTLESASLDLEVARAEILRAAGLEDFILSATASFLRQREAPVAGEFSTSKSDQLAFEAGLSKLLPTGGTFALGGSLARRQSVINFGGTDSESTKYSADATASLSQPLLRGFGSTATYAARSQAELGARAAVLARRAAAQGVLRDVVAAYWEMAYAHADLEIRRSSLTLARERRRLTDAAVRIGQVAPTEIVAVDQIIAQREEEILVAELAVTQRSLELRRLAGLEISPDAIELVPREPLAAKAGAPALEQVVDQTLATSPELAALAARGQGAKLEVEVADNGSLPRLDLALALGPLGTGVTMNEAFKSATQLDGYSASASLSYQQALGNRSAEARSTVARAELRRVEVDGRTLRLELVLAAVRAVRLAESAEKRIALNQTAIELSEKNVKAETGRFELGKSTNFDVLARQEELKQARLRHARAVVDYLLAVAIVDALTGEILAKYGVKLD